MVIARDRACRLDETTASRAKRRASGQRLEAAGRSDRVTGSCARVRACARAKAEEETCVMAYNETWLYSEDCIRTYGILKHVSAQVLMGGRIPSNSNAQTAR